MHKFKFIFFFIIIVELFLIPTTALAESGIRIDGHFYDWDNKPIQKNHYYSCAFIVQGKDAFIYEKSKNHLPKSFKISIGKNNSSIITILHNKSSNKKLEKVNYSLANKNGKTIIQNNGYLRKSQTNKMVELRIPLKKINPNISQSITMKFSTCCKYRINIITGGVSTFPIPIVLITIIIVYLTYYKLKDIQL